MGGGLDMEEKLAFYQWKLPLFFYYEIEVVISLLADRNRSINNLLGIMRRYCLIDNSITTWEAVLVLKGVTV